MTRSFRLPPPEPGTIKAHTLSAWCAAPWRDGLQIPLLAPLQRLLIRTCNSLYEIIVLDPFGAEVMVRGGQFFPEFARARVAGSSLGGSFLKLHGIYTGFRLELHTDDTPIIPVRCARSRASATTLGCRERFRVTTILQAESRPEHGRVVSILSADGVLLQAVERRRRRLWAV